MTIVNPLADNAPTDPEDRALVPRARSGERQAVEELIRRHQGWIYNVAVRMLHHPQDAEDATQEILLKALTRLSSFEERSSFRTWLYRIAFNHLLNTKRGRMEQRAVSFPSFGEALDSTPDLDLPDPSSASPDAHLLVAEAMIACTSGMLLCLDREQRLTYILGEIFGVTDTVAAELLEISSENFRQRLARARRDLHNFMNDKCGLVNRDNPCRCAKKTRLHRRWPRRSREPPVRARSRPASARGRPGSLRDHQDSGRAMRQHLPPAPVLRVADACANVPTTSREPPFQMGDRPFLTGAADNWGELHLTCGRSRSRRRKRPRRGGQLSRLDFAAANAARAISTRETMTVNTAT
jgi:RNA polymerase sigma factor (sigma-70 family)